MSQDYEDWSVRARPAVLGLAAFVGALLLLVIGGGLFYLHRYEPRTRPDPTRFPAPELETIDTAPEDRTDIPPPAPPAGVGHAMAEVVAQGDALWGQP